MVNTSNPVAANNNNWGFGNTGNNITPYGYAGKYDSNASGMFGFNNLNHVPSKNPNPTPTNNNNEEPLKIK